MEDCGEVTKAMSAEPGASSLQPSTPRDPASGDEVDRRLQRIRDYLDEALAKDNALAANLGAAASDLMLLGYQLKQAIDAALAEAPVALDRFEQLLPAIDYYLRINKQVDRMTQLDLRLASGLKAAKLVQPKLESKSGAREESQL